MASNVVLSTKEFKVVGKRPIRHDGYDKVTGKAQYGADINLPGMLHGKVLRSPHAHARILSIDTSKAEAHPDVEAVATAADFPDMSADQPPRLTHGEVIVRSVKEKQIARDKILASSKVLYKGHPIAAVAATSLHAAEEALAQIDVKYEVLPAVTDVHQATADGAPLLHDDHEGNVEDHGELSIGDVKEGFKQADIVIEREFNTKTVHQGYIEPHTATAWWLPNDRITLWQSSQGHFQIGEFTAAVLGISPSSIKVIPLEIGGGFGGKVLAYLEPIAIVLSHKSGKPVKLTMTRAEVMEATGPTSGTYQKVKMGVTKDGKLVAAEAKLMYEAGGFPGSPVGAAADCMFTPYEIENVFVDYYSVFDNKPSTGAYRAPGAPSGSFAAEAVVDELCEQLPMDPLEFRLINAAKEGTRRATGMVNPVIGCVETTEAARTHDHWTTPKKKGSYVGRGVASGFWPNATGPACAAANVNTDGTVSLTIGSVDIGGMRPAAAQQFAEVLGIPVEDVNPQVGDTESIGYTSMTGGSATAFKTGWASYEAGKDVKRQMIERAALLWDTSADDVNLVDGVLQHVSDPELSISFKELAGQLQGLGGPVVGRANLNPSGAGSAFATNLVDLEVDPETGKVTILRYTAVQDAGKAIHPSYVEGQMQGGAVQGIGWALNEEYFMGDDGAMQNTSLLDYRMPTALDLPMIDTVIVEVANPLHPYGVRGVAEVSLVPPLAAVTNAIYDAIGVRIYSLPANPATIVKAIQERNGA